MLKELGEKVLGRTALAIEVGFGDCTIPEPDLLPAKGRVYRFL